jgi:hypothetical protein
MHPRKRWTWFVLLVAAVALSAACGGQPETAEEAAPAPAAEETAPAAEVAPEPEPEPIAEEPVEQAPPQLTGNIVEIESAHDFGWTNAATREVPGKYYWVVQLRNDTTQTLDITVKFDFLNESDAIIKTDRVTVRMQPAENGTFRGEGEMARDNARAVASYSYLWDWVIVEGS